MGIWRANERRHAPGNFLCRTAWNSYTLFLWCRRELFRKERQADERGILKIADGLLVVADSIREMVKKGAESSAPEETGKKDNRQEDMAKQEQQQQISIEDVRAVLAAKSRMGKHVRSRLC